jgi:hypothetical protein
VYVVHDATFVDVLNVPVPHVLHVRLLVVVPLVPMNWPGMQVAHAVQVAAFVVVVKLPTHAAHT